jgi:gamma-glutamyltranspeptidase / glutathione hydrolase
VRRRRALSTLACAAAAAVLGLASPLGCSAAPPIAPPPAHERSVPAAELVEIALDAGADADRVAAHETPRRLAVSAENPTAARAAMDVLRRGGNAADAAVAGVLAVGVTHPVSSGIGGGGFAMVWDARTKKVTVLDFRETAPIGIVPGDYAKRPPDDKKRGAMVGVPGEIAGLAEIHARWGHLAFADLVGVAAEIADKGFPVSPHMARALKWNEKWLSKTPRYPIFQTGAGAFAAVGETVKNPALAATLRRIAAEGKKAFYEGAIAADVIATAREAGGRMTRADLEGYAVIEREPLATRWEGHDVKTMPPPSAGGVMLLETLHMHSRADLARLGYGTGAYFHVLAETFRGAIADRVRTIGDPAYAKLDPSTLTDPARMKARRARIALDATTVAEKFPLKESGTSHLVVVDAEGSVVSITSTVNNMFGAKVVAAGGFVLNDELDDFSPPALEERYGTPKGPNKPRGGARPTSSMTPTLVFKDGSPVLALGGSGGTRIATGVTQVLLANLAFGRSPADAVADPRIETPPLGGLLVDSAVGPEVVEDLRRRGEVVDTTKPNFSAVQAVAPRAIVHEAGADPRKGGHAIVE